jgi:glucokinase
MSKFYLGLDLGGTNVKAGVVDDAGQLLHNVSVPTGASPEDLTAQKVIRRMVEAAHQVVDGSGIGRRNVAAVGVLSPGQASLTKGVVLRAANLPLWRNVPLRARISQALGMPAVLENDAHAAAYGEWWAGVGKDFSGRGGTGRLDNLFMITLGTGVGGGLIYEGKVVRGAFDFATEIAHMVMIPGGEKCGCGQRGCLERYTSAKYTAQRATLQLRSSPSLQRSSSLGAIYKEHKKVTSADIVVHARQGDRFARQVWDDTCRMLALACINICHFIDPQMIVLAGGMSQAGHFLLKNVQRHFKNEWWVMTKPTATIALAKLGNDAGVIGAAGVAKEAHERNALPEIGR